MSNFYIRNIAIMCKMFFFIIAEISLSDKSIYSLLKLKTHFDGVLKNKHILKLEKILLLKFYVKFNFKNFVNYIPKCIFGFVFTVKF